MQFREVKPSVYLAVLIMLWAWVPNFALAQGRCRTPMSALVGFVEAMDVLRGPGFGEDPLPVFQHLAQAGPFLSDLNEMTGFGVSPTQWLQWTHSAIQAHLRSQDFPHTPEPQATLLLPSSATSLGRFVARMKRFGAEVRYRPDVLDEDTEAAYNYQTREIHPSHEAVATLRKTHAEAHEGAHAKLDFDLSQGKASPYHVLLESLDGKAMWSGNDRPGHYSRLQWGHELYAQARLLTHLLAELRLMRARGVDVQSSEVTEKLEQIAMYADDTGALQLSALSRQSLDALEETETPTTAIWTGDKPWLLFRVHNVKFSFPILEGDASNPKAFLEPRLTELSQISESHAKAFRELQDLARNSSSRKRWEEIYPLFEGGKMVSRLVH